MWRIMRVVLVLGLVVAAVAGLSPPAKDDVPELVVSLGPATGIVPLDAADSVAPYTFEVQALDLEHRMLYASAKTFVRPGQSRSVDRSGADFRVRGTVSLSEDGVAKYRAELFLRGRAIARSSADLKVPASR